MTSVSIIGSGAWGTALAATADRAGSETTIWSKDQETIDSILKTRINPECFGEQKFSPTIKATADLKEACQSNIIVLAVPTQVIRAVSLEIAKILQPGSYVLIASKGIEQKTGLLLSEVLTQTMPDQTVGVISGPSFAEEVFQAKPAAVTLAAPDITTGSWLARAFNSDRFRVYVSDDVIGTQIGGALKNVLAIACGLAAGKKLGENMQALLITRGLAEMNRLAIAKGANPETLCGLSGLGDVCLTCTSITSRNYKFGFEIGQGKTVAEMMANTAYLAEGVFTSKIITKLAHSLGVEMPIAFAVDAVLNKGADVNQVIHDLMSRPTKIETFSQTASEA